MLIIDEYSHECFVYIQVIKSIFIYHVYTYEQSRLFLYVMPIYIYELITNVFIYYALHT